MLARQRDNEERQFKSPPSSNTVSLQRISFFLEIHSPRSVTPFFSKTPHFPLNQIKLPPRRRPSWLVQINHLIWFEPSHKPTNDLTNNERTNQTKQGLEQDALLPGNLWSKKTWVADCTPQDAVLLCKITNTQFVGSCHDKQSEWVGNCASTQLVGSCHNKKSELVRNCVSTQLVSSCHNKNQSSWTMCFHSEWDNWTLLNKTEWDHRNLLNKSNQARQVFSHISVGCCIPLEQQCLILWWQVFYYIQAGCCIHQKQRF